jgi:hypothetical protein
MSAGAANQRVRLARALHHGPDAHHVRHWLHGGATSLDNLVLVCRAHHRAVHEGHQHLARDPTGQHTLTHSPAQPKRRLTYCSYQDERSK